MKIKVISEDFIVKEIKEIKTSKNGKYGYFILKKKGWSTLDAVLAIANHLKVNPGNFGWAGNKDNVAITEQYISGFRVTKEIIERVRLNGIELKFLGYSDERICIGELKGNYFEIVVRDLKEKKELNPKKILNLFDKQRFGDDDINLNIGRYIVKRDFKTACKILNLGVKNNDYIGALRKFERRKLLFFVNAYQSYLFNKVLEKIKGKYKEIPLVGYLTEFKNKDVEKEYNKLFKKEKIKQKDFLFREFPEISLEGTFRNSLIKPMKFKYSYSKDEMFKGKWKCKLIFELEKGAYGSMIVKQLLESEKAYKSS